MREFDRITVDVNVNSGQASIRDTGITVSEIVQKIVHEKPAAEVLVEYPGLEAEDVEEALAYAVKNLIAAMITWRIETLTPLITLKGYSDLLQRDFCTEDQQKDYLRIISEKTQEILDFTEIPNAWMHIHYGDYFVNWEQVEFSKFLEQSLRQLQSAFIVQPSISIDRLRVKANREIVAAVYFLVNDWFFIKLKSGVIVEIYEVSNKEITISIFREFDNKESHSHEAELFSWQFSPFLLARQIIQRHNLDFQVIPSDEGLTFKFRLPIWKDDSE